MIVRKYPNLWQGCIGAWCPSQDSSRSTLLTDLSGRNNHGTLTNMDPGTDWVASQGKVALDFDGTNDRVQGNANLANGSGTISLWMLSAAALGRTAFVYTVGSAPTSTWSHVIGVTSGGQSAAYLFDGGQKSVSGVTITTGFWIHAALTWVNSGNAILYTNGLAGTPTAINTAYYSAAGQCWLGSTCGATPNGISGWWNGQLDDCRIYNRALTQSEIATLSQRRGIAYETKRGRIGARATVVSTNRRRNNTLMGCGF